jgi:hypothetical protein
MPIISFLSPMKIFNSIFVIALAACSTTSSKAETFNKPVSDFEGINLKVPADVIWTDENSASFSMDCSPETEQKIEIEMDGNTLVIKSKDKSWSWDSWDSKKNKFTIRLSSSHLSKILINGSGDVVMKSKNDSPEFEYQINGSGDLKAMVDASSCTGSINGSGDVEIKGKSGSYELSINGSGDVKAFDFVCGSVAWKIAGSGDAQVHATENLSIKIAGSGDVSYKGDPKKVNQKIAGSGEIRKS